MENKMEDVNEINCVSNIDDKIIILKISGSINNASEDLNYYNIIKKHINLNINNYIIDFRSVYYNVGIKTYAIIDLIIKFRKLNKNLIIVADNFIIEELKSYYNEYSFLLKCFTSIYDAKKYCEKYLK